MNASTPRSVRQGRRLPLIAAAAAVLGALTACGPVSAADGPSTAVASGAVPKRASSSPASSSPAVPGSRLAASERVLTVDGHRTAFYVTPGKSPAIVLDSGGGLDASYWKKVAPVLAAKTGSEIISYDRPGVGRSPYVPGPWRAASAADDLAAGLAQLGVAKGAVLVSHSLAGEIAVELERRHPGIVAGAVLVDASLPTFYTPAETARIVAVNQQQLAALKGKPLTPLTRQLLDLADGYGPVHLAYHGMSWPSEVPATVIVSAQTPFVGSPSDAALWRAAQRDFVVGAANRRLVTAAGSSHDVPLDRPDVVISAVEAMVGEVSA